MELTKDQLAELAPILSAYLDEANETLRCVETLLLRSRHSRVAQRVRRLIRDRKQAFSGVSLRQCS